MPVTRAGIELGKSLSRSVHFYHTSTRTTSWSRLDIMAHDDKLAAASQAKLREKGIRIFSYPKLIYMFPTLITSVICWIGMMVVGDGLVDKVKVDKNVSVAQVGIEAPPSEIKHQTWATQRYLGMLFLGILALNLMIMAFDFPRFTVVAFLLLGSTLVFLLLWLGAFMDLIGPLKRLLSGVYIVASAHFYLGYSLVLITFYAIISLTRWLDYWEILPNELLHHHGPLSDLERFPTTNLKFDKEIPDVLEHALLGAGRLVFHVQNEKRSIILDNVLGINKKEDSLKKLMSRMEVRVTTDQETSDPEV